MASGEVRSFPLSSASPTGFPEFAWPYPALPVPGARKGAVCLLHKADFRGSSGPVWDVREPQTQLPLGGGGEAHASSQVWPFLSSSCSMGQALAPRLGSLGESLKGLERFQNKHRVLGLGFEIELRSRGKI